MANISELTPGIWTGDDLRGAPDDATVDIAEWVNAGITHVVDNRIEWSDEQLVGLVAPHIHYLHNGADESGQRMPDHPASAMLRREEPAKRPSKRHPGLCAVNGDAAPRRAMRSPS